MTPPNQDLHIYTNPLPHHLTNTIVQHPSSIPHEMNVSYNTLQQENDNSVDVVEHVVQPPHPPKEDIPSPCNDQPKLKCKCTRALTISFTYANKFKALDGHLYISTQIAKCPSYGHLVDPTSMVNIITEDYLYNKGKQHDFYDSVLGFKLIMVSCILCKVPSIFLLSYVV